MEADRMPIDGKRKQNHAGEMTLSKRFVTKLRWLELNQTINYTKNTQALIEEFVGDH